MVDTYLAAAAAAAGQSQGGIGVIVGDELREQDHIQTGADQGGGYGPQQKVHHEPGSDGHNLNETHREKD